MIVYRLIKYEGAAVDIAEMFEHSIHGTYHPGKLLITAAPVEPRIVESISMLMHALQQVSDKRWTPPAQKRAVSSPLAMSKKPIITNREVVEFILHIDGMLEEETDDGRWRYGWASDTLLGIRETVERTGCVTEGQRQAVENIENAGRG